MTQQDLRARVRQEIAEHLRDFVREAPAYVDAYIDASLSGRAARPATTLHPCMSKFCREVALDALAGAGGTTTVMTRHTDTAAMPDALVKREVA